MGSHLNKKYPTKEVLPKEAISYSKHKNLFALGISGWTPVLGCYLGAALKLPPCAERNLFQKLRLKWFSYGFEDAALDNIELQIVDAHAVGF